MASHAAGFAAILFTALLTLPVSLAAETAASTPGSTGSPQDAMDQAGKRMILVAPDSQTPSPAPPTDVRAEDKPGDEGKKIVVRWKLSADDGQGAKSVVGYEVRRATSLNGPFEPTQTKAPAGSTTAIDDVPADETDYIYLVRAMTPGGASDSAPSGPARSSPQWFRPALTIVLIWTILFCAACLLVLARAGRGANLYIRPIAGIAAIDDAIGRATEMGRPILFIPGLQEASEVPTIAAFSILARVAKKAAEYQSRVIVPCRYSMVMVVAQEVVKNAYSQAGRPDLYRERDIFFITQEQFAYVAAVNGIMLRDRPATNFYLGAFYAESLVLAETGFQAGSIQIAGTDQPIQIPFFVAACDYTLIGEELYAAAAYLSDDPKQKATLKAQDYGKAAFLAILAAGTILVSFGAAWIVKLFEISY